VTVRPRFDVGSGVGGVYGAVSVWPAVAPYATDSRRSGRALFEHIDMDGDAEFVHCHWFQPSSLRRRFHLHKGRWRVEFYFGDLHRCLSSLRCRSPGFCSSRHAELYRLWRFAGRAVGVGGAPAVCVDPPKPLTDAAVMSSSREPGNIALTLLAVTSVCPAAAVGMWVAGAAA